MPFFNKRPFLGLVSSVLAGAPFLILAGDSAGQLSKSSANAQAVLEAKRAQIQKELTACTKDEWWGEYFYGDGLGVNVQLSMAPNAGFAFTWTGCLGLYDLNYGKVQFENRHFRLLFQLPNERKGLQGISPELTPVRWSSRHYLIPADGFIEFANAVNSGFEAHEGSGNRRFLLKRGNEKLPVTGLPDIPVEYRDYILKNPIQTQIASIGTSKAYDSGRLTPVVLNVGRAEGVKFGMEFYVYRPSEIFETAQVTKVLEHSSEAEIRQYSLRQPAPSMSWMFSTDALKGRQ